MINNNQKINRHFINYKKSRFLDLQLVATIGFIIALFISFTLSYDKKLSLQNKRRLFSNKDAQALAIIQTVLVFLVSVSFLYLNYKQYSLAKKTNSNDQQDFLLQIQTSILAILSSLIGIYIVFKNYNRNLQITESEIT